MSMLTAVSRTEGVDLHQATERMIVANFDAASKTEQALLQ
jgi:hypothetical protein